MSQGSGTGHPKCCWHHPPSRTRAQGGRGWGKVSPTVPHVPPQNMSPTASHPCPLPQLSPLLSSTPFQEETQLCLPLPRTGGEVGPPPRASPTAGQLPPSSPFPQETTWPLASSTPTLGSLGRVTTITALGTGLKIRRVRQSSWAWGRMGARGGTRGESSRRPSARARGWPRTAGSLPAGNGDRAG